MKSNYLLIVVLFLSIIVTGYSQDTSILWQRTIGGDDSDFIYDVKETSDGGYILGGHSRSNISGDKTENSLGNDDYWMVKVDANGIIEWDETIGGGGTDRIVSLQQTPNGGYILGGISFSNASGDKSEDLIGFRTDYWVVKTNSLGEIEWENTIGGADLENSDLRGDDLRYLNNTQDGGYILMGYSASDISGDKTEDRISYYDFWIVKLDENGIVEWDKTIAAENNPTFNILPNSFNVTADGGYLLGGSSNEDNVNYYIIKLNETGTVIWEKTIDGNDFDQLSSVSETNDGGYILGGTSYSNAGIDKTEDNIGVSDFWVLKLDAAREIEWQNTIGGEDYEALTAIRQINGGFLLSGTSGSNISGDKTENSRGGSDYWIVNLDENGTVIWDKTIGGSEQDSSTNLIFTSDGNVMIIGYSVSPISGEKNENTNGVQDFWILKLGGILSVDENKNVEKFIISPNPVNNTLAISAKEKTIDSIKLFSTNGELIQIIEGFSGNTTIDISQLAAGVYFLQIKGDDKVVTKKFVKE